MVVRFGSKKAGSQAPEPTLFTSVDDAFVIVLFYVKSPEAGRNHIILLAMSMTV